MGKIAFFFGAGAEIFLGLPSGGQYTLDTILSKRSKMLDALADFYSNKCDECSLTYVREPLFSKNSHTFREIVERAADALFDKSTIIDENSKKLLCALKNYRENKEDDENKKIITISLKNFIII